MLTFELRAGSPAINRGLNCERSDARGAPRRLGGRCDIGAYERIRCGGVLVHEIGTAGADVLKGSGRGDGMLGLGGADVLRGGADKDGLCGGPGADKLLGGVGGDRLLGGPGADRLIGGPGNDRLRGGPGKDFERQ